MVPLWLRTRMRIEGKVVLITGASRGIGAACARAFEARGARLSLTARCAEELQKTGGEEALRTTGDITEAATRQAVIGRTLERFGAIDILINNAGMGIYLPAWRTPAADAEKVFDLNFFAPLGLIQLVVPHMQQRRSGAIVNLSSIAGQVTLPWMTLYSASKFALGSLTDGLRMELKPYGIHVMLVCPGYVKTEFQSHALGTRPPDRILKGRRFAITAETCAEAIVRGLEGEARTVVTPRAGWLLVAAERLFPAVVEGRMTKILHSGESHS